MKHSVITLLKTLPICLAIGLLGGCCTPKAVAPVRKKAVVNSVPQPGENHGIQISSIRLSAGGYIVDLRYKVIDPVRARSLATPEIKPRLIDQASGAILQVPYAPTVGALRSLGQLEPGRTYAILFSNIQGSVKAGSQVTVQFGAFQLKDLMVK